MTRNEIKKKIKSQIERATDHYYSQEISDDCLEEIMKLWDNGFTYDLPFEDCSGESMNETLSRMRYK